MFVYPVGADGIGADGAAQVIAKEAGIESSFVIDGSVCVFTCSEFWLGIADVAVTWNEKGRSIEPEAGIVAGFDGKPFVCRRDGASKSR